MFLVSGRSLITRSGFLSVSRHGGFNYVRQKNNFDAPVSRGLYVFPTGFFDVWYSLHRLDNNLPLRLLYFTDVLFRDDESMSKVRRSSSRYKNLVQDYYNKLNSGGDIIDFLNKVSLMVLPYKPYCLFHKDSGEPYGFDDYPVFNSFDELYDFSLEYTVFDSNGVNLLEIERDKYVRDNYKVLFDIKSSYYCGGVYSRVDACGVMVDDWVYYDSIGELVKALNRSGLSNYKNDYVLGGVFDKPVFSYGSSVGVSSVGHLELFIPAYGGVFKDFR